MPVGRAWRNVSIRAASPCLPRGVSCILISETDMSKPNDLVQGTLDLLLLRILALEPLHGWAISLRLKSISGDVLQVSEGSLYPALHKLEQEGWITAEDSRCQFAASDSSCFLPRRVSE